MSTETLVAVAVIGAFVGFLGGMFGKGGSAIATPLLALVGIPPIVAVASRRSRPRSRRRSRRRTRTGARA